MLDLRHNGGGLLDEAVLVSSLFVPDGVIVSTKGRKRPRQVLKATGGAIKRKPVVVLVDRGTASASEIVTAALHERLGAKVVGRRTFGKGVFGQVFDLPNDGALDLTLGNYYTPKGRNLGGKGIRPDVRAADNPRRSATRRSTRALAGAGRARPAARRRLMPADTAADSFVGVLARRGRFTVAEPLFERGRRVTWTCAGAPTRRSARWRSSRAGAGRRGRPRVVRALGRPDRARDVVEALLVERGHARRFGEPLEEAAREAARARGQPHAP